MQKSTTRLIPLMLLTLLALIVYTLGVSSTTASAASISFGHARYASKPLHQLGSTAALSPQARATTSIPSWSSSFSYGGKNYPYTMVGTNPKSGSQTTTVPVDIIPLVFKFSNGTSIDGNSVVNGIKNSALFNNASFYAGQTQYFDAFRRAEFWSTVSSSSPNYHTLLGTPTVKSSVTLTVPSSSGKTQKDSNGNTIGLVDINWFSPKADSLATKNAAPTHLVIFAAVNIYQYDRIPSQCCIGGYHTAVASGSSSYTYAYAAWDQAKDVFKDIDALTHEIAEWGDDPFVNNTTPQWTAPNYGCSNSLEVGDPAVGSDFTVGGLDYQNEVFFSWFARESPSQGYQGRYDYLGTLFSSPASGC